MNHDLAVYPEYAVSVYSGYGGIDLGLRLALGGRCRTILYCEREAYPAAILVAHMEAGNMDSAPVWSDLNTLPAREIIEYLGVDPVRVVLHGGIPCQPWSCAGERRGAADERWLWPRFWNIAQESGVGWIFMENVRGFVSGDDPGIDLVLRDLSRAGWNAEWDMFSAAECGAPHERQRLFLLAHSPLVGSGEGRAEGARRVGKSAPVGGGDAVADRHGDGQQRTRVHEGSGREGQGTSVDCRDGQLADTGGAGQQGGERGSASWQGEAAFGSATECRSYWPARPGEEQHDAEPPRVVVYAKRSRQKRRKDADAGGNAVPEHADRADRTAQTVSRVGGDAYGPAVRVDAGVGGLWSKRISSLGKGVVPVGEGECFRKHKSRVIFDAVFGCGLL
ncbi:MAG: DNA cytosine methyltransferase, partial [Planctomycetaceae bacterium]|nr:DNA cytosine methyltransferase [Planctomycetaceae bacterium]